MRRYQGVEFSSASRNEVAAEGLLWVKLSRSGRPANVGSQVLKQTKLLRLTSAMNGPSHINR
jgi:hypothetical protein